MICLRLSKLTDTNKSILRQGAVYLRRPGAETSEVSTPEDWEDLINRCVRLRRDEFLIEFRELFERMMTPKPPSPSTTEELSRWMEQMREKPLEESEEGGS